MHKVSAILAGTLLLAGLPGAAQDSGRGSRTGCAALEAAARPEADSATARGSFSATRTLDVGFTATFVPASEALMPGSAVLTITTPRGHLYQEIAIPIGSTSENGAMEKTRTLPGYRHPVKVVHPVADDRTRGDFRSDPRSFLLSLPPLLVGGTSIQNGGLYGTWKAEFRTGDGSTPCSTTFQITP